MDTIPYSTQQIEQVDIDAVIKVLKGDWLTQGPTIQAFEIACAKYCQVPYATAVANATCGLHLAYLALGLGPNQSMWTSPNTYLATANAALYCGAKVEFVDIDPKTYNLCPEHLANKLKQAKRLGKDLPKIVTVVHFAGQPCDMKSIYALSKEYGFHVVEDAAHALGAYYHNQPIGNCEYSDIAVFSFHPVKNITTGEGGILTTRCPAIDAQLKLLRSHGVTRDPDKMTKPAEGPWYYEQIALGFNYRITDIQVALGLSQLTRLDEFLNKRRALASRYNTLLSELPVITPYVSPQVLSAFHLYPIQLELKKMSLTRLECFNAMRQAGIGVNVLYMPVSAQPYYQQLGFKARDTPNALKYYEHSFVLPLHPKLTTEQQDYVVNTLRTILG